MEDMEEREERREDKREPVREGRRRKGQVAGLLASALVFGTVAGGAMVGVNVLAGRGISKETVAESSASQADTLLKGAEKGSSIPLNKSEKTESGESAESVSSIVKSAMPSVVSITNMMQYKQNGYSIFGGGEQSGETAASGSGVIIGKNDTELLVVTNHHVVENSSSLSVQFVDGKSADAEIKGEDSSADLAVIAIKLSDLSKETLEKIKVAEFGDSDSLQVGDQVVAIGNALGYGQSVTTGIVSAKDREIETENGTESGLIQTDAAINPGNSGGALLNMSGRVIGINVAKYSDTKVEGMGYSIPSKKAENIVNELSTKTTRSKVSQEDRGYLGIQAKTVDSQTANAYGMPEGIYVYKITEESKAADAGLQEKDIITSFDGQSVESLDDLSSLLARYKAGESVKLTVQRLSGNGKYEEKELTITLSAAPKSEKQKSSARQREEQEEQQGQSAQGDSEDEILQEFRKYFERG